MNGSSIAAAIAIAMSKDKNEPSQANAVNAVNCKAEIRSQSAINQRQLTIKLFMHAMRAQKV